MKAFHLFEQDPSGDYFSTGSIDKSLIDGVSNIVYGNIYAGDSIVAPPMRGFMKLEGEELTDDEKRQYSIVDVFLEINLSKKGEEAGVYKFYDLTEHWTDTSSGPSLWNSFVDAPEIGSKTGIDSEGKLILEIDETLLDLSSNVSPLIGVREGTDNEEYITIEGSGNALSPTMFAVYIEKPSVTVTNVVEDFDARIRIDDLIYNSLY